MCQTGRLCSFSMFSTSPSSTVIYIRRFCNVSASHFARFSAAVALTLHFPFFVRRCLFAVCRRTKTIQIRPTAGHSRSKRNDETINKSKIGVRHLYAIAWIERNGDGTNFLQPRHTHARPSYCNIDRFLLKLLFLFFVFFSARRLLFRELECECVFKRLLRDLSVRAKGLLLLFWVPRRNELSRNYLTCNDRARDWFKIPHILTWDFAQRNYDETDTFNISDA